MSTSQTIVGVVSHSTPVKVEPILATTELIQAHQHVVQPVSGQPDFFDMLKHTYSWFAKKNQVEAEPYLEGALIAREYGIRQQVLLYANRILSIVTRDRAESTLQLVEHYIGYKGQIYYRPDNQDWPTQQFSVAIPPAQTHSTSDRYEWIYYPVAAYGALIPPQALQVLVLVQEHSAPAQAYWVADKVKVQATQRLSVDPLLCAQYGRWFVSICQWA